ncbi:unnamed protein product [Nippostrongylus brasiliensis]|uniref:Uncharacterized protein n=1 Tax=Nippostrongylus brasiliensis TaxID=27835 RepID=A0A0N4XWC0_NIPBR|nr:unnamed protein product [Nippostrongylus brasiliensis]
MADTHNDLQLDEEDLLRSPTSDSSGDEMENDGRMPDKRVEVLRKQVENLGQENTVTVAHDRKILSGMVDIDSISPHVLRAYDEQRLRQESRNAVAAGHRATTSGDGDTSPLTISYMCPGRSRACPSSERESRKTSTTSYGSRKRMDKEKERKHSAGTTYGAHDDESFSKYATPIPIRAVANKATQWVWPRKASER